MLPLPEDQTEENFCVHALEGIEPAAPTIEQTAMPEEAHSKDGERGEDLPSTDAIWER